MNNSRIEEGAYIEKSVIDKKVIIGKNAKVGYGEDYTINREKPELFFSGINAIAKSVIIPDNTTIERNCSITSTAIITEKVIKSGTTI